MANNQNPLFRIWNAFSLPTSLNFTVELYEDHTEQVVESHAGIHNLLWDFPHASVLETTGVLGYWHIRCSHSNPCRQVGEHKNLIWSFANAVCLKIKFQKQNGFSCSLNMSLNLVKLCFLWMHFLETPRDNTAWLWLSGQRGMSVKLTASGSFAWSFLTWHWPSCPFLWTH